MNIDVLIAMAVVASVGSLLIWYIEGDE